MVRKKEQDVLLSVAEVAKLTKKNPATVWRYIKAGLTPARPQPPYVFWQSDVEAFMASRRQPGRPEGSKDSRPRRKPS